MAETLKKQSLKLSSAIGEFVTDGYKRGGVDVCDSLIEAIEKLKVVNISSRNIINLIQVLKKQHIKGSDEL